MSARTIFLFVLVALVPTAILAMRPAPWRPPFGRPPISPLISENLRKSIYSLCYRNDASSQSDKDACYGCFMRVTNGMMCNGSQSLLAQCAKDHLKDTDFERCAIILEQETEEDEFNASTLCEFESCIRRVNMDVIIKQCAEEMPEGATFASNYLNMTACILANYRCRTVRREMYGPRSLQALMVTDDYQLRISDVPGIMSGYECSMQEYHQPHVIQQAPWPSADCSEMACQ